MKKAVTFLIGSGIIMGTLYNFKKAPPKPPQKKITRSIESSLPSKEISSFKQKREEVRPAVDELKMVTNELGKVLREKNKLIGNTWQQQRDFENQASEMDLAKLNELNEREVQLSKKRLSLLKTIKQKMVTRRI